MFISEIFFYLSVAIIATVFAAQVWVRRRTLVVARTFFFASFIAVLAYVTYVSYLQYQAFNGAVLGLTLGTIDGLKWFFGYIQLHFLNEYLISLIAAFLIIFIAQYINKKRGSVHFEEDELYTAALSIFLVGYPGFIFYIPIVLLASVLVSLLFVRHGERLPLYHFWAPTGIAVLLAIHFWAGNQVWWAAFRF